MKKILIPTDFSACAANAVDFAIQSAKLMPASITLLHAFNLPGTMYPDTQGLNAEFGRVQWDEDERQLEAIKQELEDKQGIHVEVRLVAAPLTIAIEDLLEKEKYDLIVMGTLGASGLAEKLWGSNTADVIGMRRLPVLAIPHQFKWRKPERFLFATGNFEKVPVILDTVFDLAAIYGAHVDVAVYTDENEEAAAFLEHGRKAPYYGDMLMERYGGRDLHTMQLTGKHLENSLQEYIANNNIDMLAMVTYKRGFWSSLFHPSQTKKMSFHTRIPLLAVPGRDDK